MSEGEPVLNLARLLHPMSMTTFFAEWWERRPLHIARGDGTWYGELLAMRDVDALIAFADPRGPDIRATKQGDAAAYPITFSGKMGSARGDGSVDINRVYAAYRAGYTINVNRVQLYWAPVAALCAALEDALDHEVIASLFLAPASSQGFDAHYDAHDVFVVQLEGAKRWRLRAPVENLPLRSGVVGELDGELLMDVTLQAGDLLYVPSGTVHEVRTDDRASLHLTIGIVATRWLELIREALNGIAADDVRLRRAVPLDNRGEIEAGLRALLPAVVANARADVAVERLRAAAAAARPQPVVPGHFAELDLLADGVPS
ncbi:MAG TPA: cupin domain-containing protein [Thermoanaerobaculia bacterium]|jgi:ribosomal protein L16 Arg81 hydroxylase|nr:cupin domain-containing protein [Thermoanaerobaculia bacterium]